MYPEPNFLGGVILFMIQKLIRYCDLVYRINEITRKLISRDKIFLGWLGEGLKLDELPPPEKEKKWLP